MSGGLLSRLSRRWWLMLIVGLVIGIGIGFPLWGSVNPGELAGTTYIDNNFYINTQVGLTFTVTCSRDYYNDDWGRYNCDDDYFEYIDMDQPAGYLVLQFQAKKSTGDGDKDIKTYAPEYSPNNPVRNIYHVKISK